MRSVNEHFQNSNITSVIVCRHKYWLPVCVENYVVESSFALILCSSQIAFSRINLRRNIYFCICSAEGAVETLKLILDTPLNGNGRAISQQLPISSRVATHSPTGKQAQKQILVLDGVRAIACLVVLSYHMSILIRDYG